MENIKLNDILKIDNLANVKIRFYLMFGGHYWNYDKKKSYQEGQITVGFIRIKSNENLWLLFHIGKITNDLNIQNGVGYEYETLTEYEKYFGRIIVRFKNKSQDLVRKAESVINDCEIAQILPDVFDNDIFPGYEKVNVSWPELSRVISKDNWMTALQNQKGVYLLTDISNGKNYVGSAYGENMILGRWGAYVKTGQGGNVGLKALTFDYINKTHYYF